MIDWLERRAAPQLVHDREMVRVERLAEDGTLFYRKRFHADLQEDGWLGRENRILHWFSIRDPYPRHLVRLKPVNFVAGGRFDVLDTYDAGPSLKEWGSVEVPVPDEPGRRIAPFLLCNTWWRLAGAALKALDELHGLGMVHGDIKEDNVCVPFDPDAAARGQLVLQLDDLRLIDVTYSILPGVPLTRPLPLEPLPNSYQSRLLQDAIAADARLGRPDHANRLDWRIDMFSLGSMLERLREGLLDSAPGCGWDNVLRAKARDLIAQLKAYDSTDAAAAVRRDSRPHARHIEDIAEVIRALPTLQSWPIGGIPRSGRAEGDGAPQANEREVHVQPGVRNSFAPILRRRWGRLTTREVGLALVVGTSIIILLFLFYRTLAR